MGFKGQKAKPFKKGGGRKAAPKPKPKAKK